MALKSLPVTAAREHFAQILDDASDGKGTMIIRNSKEAAAVLPPHLAHLLPLVDAILRDLGESLEMSQDAEIVAAFERASAEIERENITWYEI